MLQTELKIEFVMTVSTTPSNVDGTEGIACTSSVGTRMLLGSDSPTSTLFSLASFLLVALSPYA